MNRISIVVLLLALLILLLRATRLRAMLQDALKARRPGKPAAAKHVSHDHDVADIRRVG